MFTPEQREKIVAEDFVIKRGRRRGVGVFYGRLKEFASLSVWWSGKEEPQYMGEYSWEAAERIVATGELKIAEE